MPCPLGVSWEGMRRIELAMPAGTLEEALIALRSGADAVYFGMKEFSARKNAGNFSEEDLAKIRRFALENGRRIYIAVNTLADDVSLPRLMRLLDTISHYGCDGVIVQDLGAVRIIRERFPGLPLHGSTQLAVHTIGGVKALQHLGFERVVLSRELSLDEIRRIREACPDIELKVFIHGALCYGFSGLCMASRIITGRSANEGACAQICRSWFRDSSGRKACPFSLEDLDGASLVRELMDMGIDSLKVEGRLKGPDYAKTVAQYYRAAIDGTGCRALEGPAAAAFRRKAGTGWLADPCRHDMQTGIYTGHRGYPLGRIERTGGHVLQAACRAPIMPHDGLMVLSEGEAIRFRPEIIGRNGNTYTLQLDNPLESSDDGILYRISDSSAMPASPSLDIRKAKRMAEARITIGQDSLTIETGKLVRSYAVSPEQSGHDGTEAIIKVLSQSGESSHQLRISGISGSAGFPFCYINPKRLKEIRRAFLAEYDAIPDKEPAYSASMEDGETPPLPARRLLSGPHAPWNTAGTAIGDRRWFTLPPIRFDEEGMYARLLSAAKPGDAIGLSNIADILFAKAHPEFLYFVDIYLYLSNREAAALLMEEVPGLIGGYLWMERDSYGRPWPFTPTIVEDFQPPLFLSRAWTEEGIYEQNGRRYSAVREDGITIVSEVD